MRKTGVLKKMNKEMLNLMQHKIVIQSLFISRDENILRSINRLMKKYIRIKLKGRMTADLECRFQGLYKKLHCNFHEPLLKEWTQFDILQTLYRQQYIEQNGDLYYED